MFRARACENDVARDLFDVSNDIDVRSDLADHIRRHLSDGRHRHPQKAGYFIAMEAFYALLRMARLDGPGVRNAHDVRLRRVAMPVQGLPEALNGFSILHLSDLHLDASPYIAEAIRVAVSGVRVDLCALTGDYRLSDAGEYRQVFEPLARIMAGTHSRLGFHAVMGNHDSDLMVPGLREMGIDVLDNSGVDVEHNGCRLRLVGLDYVHRFHRPTVAATLEAYVDGFSIVLAHSPEIAREAAEAGAHVLLAGHTHGGQVCLPGGRPIITQMTNCRKYGSGLWRCGRMAGHTTYGAGFSGLPIRFFSRGEAVILELVPA
jgi:predicted MPP superfamily phosphohydrolase